ncbi:aldose 1-epimerase family protein [Flavobacterium sp. NG2]|uniref:aldose 1-epimerase family protein n=1 Tax=Flavobacterium sp. NG2 TaxID=3097547 RepID=UPI002A82B261|nr:aldose 1-epimerase family protein [Flavobacterium sp. NG2]WPR71949.1 aldose 1-epimerase family protein [Flavobacterium sp. NG2]
MKNSAKTHFNCKLIVLAILMVSANVCCSKANNSKIHIDLKTLKTDSIYTIKNDFISFSVNSKGAEMTSCKTADLEYVWQANPEFWPRQSPILFPIVGRLVDHEYVYKGKTYPMMQHGFARDNEFKLIEKTANSITLEQRATADSKKIFPFDFILQVKYSLSGKIVSTTYTVKNPSDTEELYFSIGAHPAFNCPFERDQKREEYELVFDKQIKPEYYSNVDGLYEGDSFSVFDKKGIMPLPKTIFDRGSLTFNPNPFSKVTFVHKPTQKKYLSLTFKNFPYLGIWSINDSSPFVCIEPWHGIADLKTHNKDFTQKKGIEKLAPNKSFSCSFLIEVL